MYGSGWQRRCQSARRPLVTLTVKVATKTGRVVPRPTMVSKEDAAAAKIQARSRGQAHRKGKSSPGMHSHAQGSQRLHQVKTVYGINEPKKLSPLEQRLAALEKENSLLRLRLDPLDPAAATAAQQAADQSAKGFVSSQNKGGGGGPVKDEAVDAWKLDSWIRSLGLDGVVASALLKHLKKTSG
eukprot:3255063-Prymnesium_polylepis.1